MKQYIHQKIYLTSILKYVSTHSFVFLIIEFSWNKNDDCTIKMARKPQNRSFNLEIMWLGTTRPQKKLLNHSNFYWKKPVTHFANVNWRQNLHFPLKMTRTLLIITAEKYINTNIEYSWINYQKISIFGKYFWYTYFHQLVKVSIIEFFLFLLFFYLHALIFNAEYRYLFIICESLNESIANVHCPKYMSMSSSDDISSIFLNCFRDFAQI